MNNLFQYSAFYRPYATVNFNPVPRFSRAAHSYHHPVCVFDGCRRSDWTTLLGSPPWNTEVFTLQAWSLAIGEVIGVLLLDVELPYVELSCQVNGPHMFHHLLLDGGWLEWGMERHSDHAPVSLTVDGSGYFWRVGLTNLAELAWTRAYCHNVAGRLAHNVLNFQRGYSVPEASCFPLAS